MATQQEVRSIEKRIQDLVDKDEANETHALYMKLMLLDIRAKYDQIAVLERVIDQLDHIAENVWKAGTS